MGDGLSAITVAVEPFRLPNYVKTEDGGLRHVKRFTREQADEYWEAMKPLWLEHCGHHSDK